MRDPNADGGLRARRWAVVAACHGRRQEHAGVRRRKAPRAPRIQLSRARPPPDLAAPRLAAVDPAALPPDPAAPRAPPPEEGEPPPERGTDEHAASHERWAEGSVPTWRGGWCSAGPFAFSFASSVGTSKFWVVYPFTVRDANGEMPIVFSSTQQQRCMAACAAFAHCHGLQLFPDLRYGFPQ